VEGGGWTEQVVALGSNRTRPKPFARLAVMEPAVPVVRSRMTTRKPPEVSNM